ncbi:MAG TPA: SGNH/GDSL hydrolase family protein [Polyangiaceae bacterium]|nr:SGNH/GDSL hydrolase family protein [Polyangiaceae bacterium]
MTVVAGGACGGERVRLGDAIGGAHANTGGAAGVESGGNAGSGASTTTSGSAGEGGMTSCSHGLIQANQVLWIGDSWVTLPGEQHLAVRDFARAAGAIGMDEDYVVLATPAAGIEAISKQYEAQQSTTNPPKVVIMDGGTWDTLVDNGAEETVAAVVVSFERLLAKIAADGSVQHVIYYLMPELASIGGVAALRPPLMRACQQSTVPCHFIDLQPLWLNHPEYTARDGIQASDAGAAVIAESIWGIMRENCIAQ